MGVIEALIGCCELNYAVGFEGTEFFTKVAVSRDVLVTETEDQELSTGFCALLISISDVDYAFLSEGVE